jgi:hypothetical protein
MDREEKKKIRLQILDMQRDHCDVCKDPKRYKAIGRSEQDPIYCTTKCTVGMKLRHLGNQLINDEDRKGRVIEKKPEKEKMEAVKVEIPKSLPDTKDSYERLTEMGVKDRKAAKIMNIGLSTLYVRKKAWGLVKEYNTKNKAVEAERVNTEAAAAAPVEEQKVIAYSKYKTLLDDYNNVMDELGEFKAKKEDSENLREKVKQQEEELEKRRQQILSFRDLSKAAIEAIDYSRGLQCKLDHLIERYHDRTEDKDIIIQNLQERICKLEDTLLEYMTGRAERDPSPVIGHLESLLVDYLPKGRLEWLTEKTKS